MNRPMIAAYKVDGKWYPLANQPREWRGRDVDVVIIFTPASAQTNSAEIMSAATSITRARGGIVLNGLDTSDFWPVLNHTLVSNTIPAAYLKDGVWFPLPSDIKSWTCSSVEAVVVFCKDPSEELSSAASLAVQPDGVVLDGIGTSYSALTLEAYNVKTGEVKAAKVVLRELAAFTARSAST